MTLWNEVQFGLMTLRNDVQFGLMTLPEQWEDEGMQNGIMGLMTSIAIVQTVTWTRKVEKRKTFLLGPCSKMSVLWKKTPNVAVD